MSQPFCTPIHLLGSLQFFADVRKANSNLNSISSPSSARGLEARSTPGDLSPNDDPPGVSAVQGEGVSDAI